MSLTDVAVRNAKPGSKPRKLFDERGLYLLVDPKGGKWWRLKYRIDGREKLLSLGTYPDTNLKRAREKRDEARTQIADGTDPASVRRAQRIAQANTFEAIAKEHTALRAKKLHAQTSGTKVARFETYVFPYIGRQPIRKISAPDILTVLRRIEAKGKNETAHRIRANIGAVFRYAIATGRAERDPTTDLRGALAPVIVTNRAAITDPARIGQLLRAIDAYCGQPATEAALKLAPLVFVRPGELRAAEWREFDINGKEPTWRIPGARMKMDDEHIVPLSRQAVRILRAIEPVTGGGRYVFPSLRGGHRPLSSNTINVALRSMGYSNTEMTGHGFRAMASTLLNEQGFPPDVIELQLAHAERNEVRAAYNRAKRIPERRKMMQAWADYLDGLKAGGNVVPLKRRA
ncbi:MAG: integrase arm-type DNA-binding domain-containing protein [Nevskiaceae bacterium]|jgi:integrase|nr:integrase arm-type DNA-binding domain-containing protein [Nevskiaceae bacterium]